MYIHQAYDILPLVLEKGEQSNLIFPLVDCLDIV